MKKTSWIALLGAVALAGCAKDMDHDMGGMHHGPIRSVVSFDGTQITVSPAILVVPASAREVTAEWVLSAQASATFPSNGIVIEGAIDFPTETQTEKHGYSSSETRPLPIDPKQRSNFGCTRDADGKKISCTSKQLVPGIYKYTIRVQANDDVVFKVDPPWVVR